MLTIRCNGRFVSNPPPFVYLRYLLLPRSPDRADVHQRALLHAEVTTPRGPFHLFVTHLSLSEEAREESVLSAYAHMQQFGCSDVDINVFV